MGHDPRYYKDIETALNVSAFTWDQQKELNAKFRSACRKYGLPIVDGSASERGRRVDDYGIQAGVAHTQLPDLARAFLRAEEAFGPAPNEDSVRLSQWARNAVDAFVSNRPVVRRVVEHDRSGYHAAAFVRLRQDKASASSPFEQAFAQAIEKAFDSKVGGPAVVPKARLIFQDGELALHNPAVTASVTERMDGQDWVLGPGARIGLPVPWPVDRIGQDEMLAFDEATGALLNRLRLAGQTDEALDTPTAYLLARRPFRIDGENSFELGDEAHVRQLALERPAMVEIGHHRITLSLLARPRVILTAEAVSASQGMPLVVLPSCARVFLGSDMSPGDIVLVAEHPALDKAQEVPLSPDRDDASGGFWATLPTLPEGGFLGALRLTLRIKNQHRPLAKTTAWVWPGLKGIRSGVVFDAVGVPDNFDAAASRHIDRANGRLSLSDSNDYVKAALAFAVDRRTIFFPIARPGVSLAIATLNQPDQPLPWPAEIPIGEHQHSGASLVVRTDDRQAKLDICGRIEEVAFSSGVRRIPIVALGRVDNLHNRVRYMPKGDASLAYDVAFAVETTAPLDFAVLSFEGETRVKLHLRIPVDALRLELVQAATGKRLEGVFAFAHDLVDGPILSGVTAIQDDANRAKIAVGIRWKAFADGPWIVRFWARKTEEDTWLPVINNRLDEYAVAFHGTNGSVSEGEPETTAFERLNTHLMRCYAEKPWSSIEEVIVAAWRHAGANLVGSGQGMRALLGATGQAQPATASRTWIPMLHPLELSPALFEAPAADFAVLGDAGAEGMNHLAHLALLAREGDVRDLVDSGVIWPGALAGFATPAGGLGPLVFERFEKAIRSHPEAASNYWIPERHPWLTAQHHNWSCARFADRVEIVAPDQSNRNRWRIPTAAKVLHQTARLAGARALPAPPHLVEKLAIVGDVGAALSVLARASRFKSSGWLWAELSRNLDLPTDKVLRTFGFAIRLAPELFSFYLVLWELAARAEA